MLKVILLTNFSILCTAVGTYFNLDDYVMSSFPFSDVQSTETFRQSGGAKVVVDILNGNHQNSDVLDGVFSVIASAATGNEVLKESFMDMKIGELILQIMRENASDTPESLYNAIRVLLTPDDDRVVASQVCRSLHSYPLIIKYLLLGLVIMINFSTTTIFLTTELLVMILIMIV